jgi:glycosyltransferase involved in cell wall biosynthesis
MCVLLFNRNNRKTQKILFVASFAACPRVWKMASTLATSGYKVAILEWERDSTSPIAPINGVSYQRFRLSAPYGQGAALRLVLWWAFLSTYVILHNFSVIQPQNLDNLLPVSLICRLKRTKIVYDIADFYSDSFIPSKFMASGLRNFVSWLERLLINTVNVALIVDQTRLKQIGHVKKPVKIIYNSPSPLLTRMDKVIERPSRSVFTLFYAGILGVDRGLDLLVKAVKGNDSVQLIVAGFGHLEKDFIKDTKGIPNIRYLGRIPYEKVLEFTAACNCIVALYDPRIPNNVYASPNKLFEAMMCGKPIIVNSGTSMADIVDKEKCGLIVKYGDVNELKNALNKLKNNKPLSTLLGDNSQRAYTQKYNWQLMEQTLISIYQKMQ